jgi:hypothetical protein
MTKSERLEYIKRKMTEMETVTDAVIPPSKRDIREELELMDSFQEHQRDKKKLKNHLTSDEG